MLLSIMMVSVMQSLFTVASSVAADYSSGPDTATVFNDIVFLLSCLVVWLRATNVSTTR